MVFVTVGSTRNDFRRLLRAVDELAGRGILTDVFAQIGMSAYVPRNCSSERFLKRERFLEMIREARFVIGHAGTGTVNTCLGMGKKLIVVPRRKDFGEHPDDHQLELSSYLAGKGSIIEVGDPERELEAAVLRVESWTPVLVPSRGSSPLLDTVEDFLKNAFSGKNPAVLHNLD